MCFVKGGISPLGRDEVAPESCRDAATAIIRVVCAAIIVLRVPIIALRVPIATLRVPIIVLRVPIVVLRVPIVALRVPMTAIIRVVCAAYVPRMRGNALRT